MVRNIVKLYGIRGATTTDANERELIIERTKELLRALFEANRLEEENVVSIIFTTTPDLTAEFPAKACRLMGWNNAALLGAVEADVPHGLRFCIRVLIHAYLEKDSEVRHVYLREAVGLRPDRVEEASS